MIRVRVQVEIVCGLCYRREWVWSVLEIQDEVDRVPVDIASLGEKEIPPGWRMAEKYYQSDRCPDCEAHVNAKGC